VLTAEKRGETVAEVKPQEDIRWKKIEGAMRKHGNTSDALIETLHTVQDVYGYLDEKVLHKVAVALRVPLSSVYGVATFYHIFTLKPKGLHTCVVCMGTACYIKGAQAVLDLIEKEYGIKPGETTEDGKLSVLTARCLGSCSLAPAVVIDGEIIGKMAPEKIFEKLQGVVNHDS